MYIVTPGLYNLEYISVDGVVKKAARNIGGVAQFTVNGGEIIYLGNLVFDLRHSSVPQALKIKDSFDDIISGLPEDKLWIQGKIKKRLLQIQRKNLQGVEYKIPINDWH